jgi:aspartate racemase
VRHIGILAHSADGAALCFLEVVRESARRLGAHDHPEITLSVLPMAHVLPAYHRGDMAEVRAFLARTVERLAGAGCDFFVCSDNTAHLGLEAPGPPLPLPGLHIAAIVARRAQADGHRCIGLLGTRWTMTGPVYRRAFARAGLELKTPPPHDQDWVSDVIFNELTQGILRDESRVTCLNLIAELKRAGCDAVALSCTELPLLVSPEDSPLPTLDSTRLLAHEAVALACGDDALPSWRGGPPS